VAAGDAKGPRSRSALFPLYLQEAQDSSPPSTKLACTIGQVSNDVNTLCELLKAGMSVSA